jgi:hypothetical protein
MFTSENRAVSLVAVCLAVGGCSTTAQMQPADATPELVGRVTERTFGSVLPGRVPRELGQSAFQQRLSPGQERTALPFPVYQHRILISPERLVTVASESSTFGEGTCVRVSIPTPPKPPRILGAVPCTQ